MKRRVKEALDSCVCTKLHCLLGDVEFRVTGLIS